MSSGQRHFSILDEVVVRTEDYQDDAPENPYWLDEEPDPHPNPELGCIRRNKCCKNFPGWFGPGEVEKAAAFLELEPAAFVKKYIIIDHTEVDGERVEVFVPVKLGKDRKPLIPPATRADSLYQVLRGPCVFFDGAGCTIYGARPVECRGYVCTQPPQQNISHETIARMWRDGQPAPEDP